MAPPTLDPFCCQNVLCNKSCECYIIPKLKMEQSQEAAQSSEYRVVFDNICTQSDFKLPQVRIMNSNERRKVHQVIIAQAGF